MIDEDDVRPFTLTVVQTFTLADGRALYRFMYWRGRPLPIVLGVLLLYVIGLYFYGVTFWSITNDVYVTIGLSVGIVLLFVLYGRRKAARWSTAFVTKKEMTVTMSEIGVFAVQRDAHATHESTYTWAAFTRFVERPTFFLLVLPTRVVVPLVKRFLDEDEIEDVYIILSDHLSEKRTVIG